MLTLAICVGSEAAAPRPSCERRGALPRGQVPDPNRVCAVPPAGGGARTAPGRRPVIGSGPCHRRICSRLRGRPAGVTALAVLRLRLALPVPQQSHRCTETLERSRTFSRNVWVFLAPFICLQTLAANARRAHPYRLGSLERRVWDQSRCFCALPVLAVALAPLRAAVLMKMAAWAQRGAAAETRH